jgi:Zn-dependent M28 family amino/carboxypeptidase
MMTGNYTKLALFGYALLAANLFAQTQYNAVKENVVKQRLDLYLGNDTKRETALIQLFTQAGCIAPNLSEQPVPSRKQPNVICVLPGSTAETIVVGAHFDHVSAGDGVVDNWSGASLLPSLLQSLIGSPRKHTFVFVGFTGEEEGLLGSAYYVQQLSPDQLSKIEAMINLDTLGLGPTKIWVSQSDPRLVNGLANLAHSMNLPVAGVNINGFGESDEESFIAQKVCTLTVHSLTLQTAYVLHRPDDNPSAMRFSDYYETYRLLAAYLTLLDTGLQADGHVCTAKPVSELGARGNRVRIGSHH